MIEVINLEWGWYDRAKDIFHSDIANSAGGVSLQYNLVNHGEKAVKKYAVYFKAINGANEPALCTIQHTAVQGVAGYDRIDSNCETDKLLAENLWYSHAIRDVIVDHIEVVYTDETTESCTGNYIPNDEEIEQEIKTEYSTYSEETKKNILYVIELILVIVLFFIAGIVYDFIG